MKEQYFRERKQPAGLINGIRGWYYDPETVEEANREGRLLTLDYEFGSACKLRCIYCYRTEDSRDEDHLLLPFDEWKRVVDDAKDLGVKSMKLIGGGEITEEKRFLEAMEYIANNDIIIVLFTAGTVLGDEKLCRSIHGISRQEFAQRLYDMGMSIFLKVDSFDDALQDKIAGKKGFARQRGSALELLLNMDFNAHNPTRLGLEVNVSRHNLHEILDIYRMRIQYNMYEDVVISMPCDAYFRNTNYDISLEEKKELYRQIYHFNAEHDIPVDNVSPFMGGLVCTQLGNGLYVTCRGDVFHCPGAFEHLGNVRKESLREIWQAFHESKNHHQTFFCPFREHTNIIPTELVEKIQKEFGFWRNNGSQT
ncbi:MAG: radical SAM protein [Candidatus Aenigmarchaeota archaeon]|nr:radical SAM protein [Candidatus Aenigmarchaeota archaeon]